MRGLQQEQCEDQEGRAQGQRQRRQGQGQWKPIFVSSVSFTYTFRLLFGMCLPVCDSVLAWQRTERDWNCSHQPTHFNNTLVFALSKADRATRKKPSIQSGYRNILPNNWLETNKSVILQFQILLWFYWKTYCLFLFRVPECMVKGIKGKIRKEIGVSFTLCISPC